MTILQLLLLLLADDILCCQIRLSHLSHSLWVGVLPSSLSFRFESVARLDRPMERSSAAK